MDYFNNVLLIQVVDKFYEIIFFISFTNAGNWLTYASIINESKIYYNKTTSDIIWLGNVYYITFIIFSYFGSWTVYRFFKWSMISGITIGAIGSWIRFFALKNYTFAIIGQELNAFAQIWVLETPIGSYIKILIDLINFMIFF